jgi:flagellar export protein FliJ
MSPKQLKRTLVIKERLRQVRRAELHEAETRVAQAEQSVQTENALHSGAAALVTRQGEVSAADLAYHAEQTQRADRSLKRARAELNTLQGEREVRREEVSEATREVRAIEAVRTRLVADERRAADHREQSELDEVSARKGKRL